MTLAKTLILAAIFGGLAQTAVKSGHSSPPDKSAAPTTTQAAETFFNDVRAEIRRGLEHASSSRDIGSKELDGLVSLLDSSSTKLKEAGLEEKLNQAEQKAEALETRALAVLKDPENKAILARDLQPEEYLDQIHFQKARAVILTQKIQRLRNTLEEMRKYSHILEGVMPRDELSERLHVRLSQLLSEWPEQSATKAIPESLGSNQLDLEKRYSDSRTSPSASFSLSIVNNQAGERDLGSQIVSRAGSGSDFFGPAAKVIVMSRKKAQEKSILKYISRCPEPFGIGSADQILQLRDQGVSGAAIAAMLRHDDQLKVTASHRD